MQQLAWHGDLSDLIAAGAGVVRHQAPALRGFQVHVGGHQPGLPRALGGLQLDLQELKIFIKFMQKVL